MKPPQVQLRAVGVDIPPEPEGGDSAALALTLDMLEMPAEELERRFRDVWGNNADEIRSETRSVPGEETGGVGIVPCLALPSHHVSFFLPRSPSSRGGSRA